MEAYRIKQCVLLSSYAYEDRDTIESKCRSMGFSGVRHIGGEDGNTGFFAVDGRTAFLVFCGTKLDDALDVVCDARVLPRMSYFGGWVHRGFSDHADSRRIEIEDAIMAAKGRSLWLTGHSLGGAVATHAAIIAGHSRRYFGKSLPYLVTAGCPTLGTRKFCRAVVANTSQRVRITNGADPIARGPLWPLYLHAKAEHLHFHSDGIAEWNPSLMSRLRDFPSGVARRLPKAIWTGLSRLSYLRAVAELAGMSQHRMSLYVDNVSKWYERNYGDEK